MAERKTTPKPETAKPETTQQNTNKPEWDVSTHGEPTPDQAARYNVTRP